MHLFGYVSLIDIRCSCVFILQVALCVWIQAHIQPSCVRCRGTDTRQEACGSKLGRVQNQQLFVITESSAPKKQDLAPTAPFHWPSWIDGSWWMDWGKLVPPKVLLEIDRIILCGTIRFVPEWFDAANQTCHIISRTWRSRQTAAEDTPRNRFTNPWMNEWMNEWQNRAAKNDFSKMSGNNFARREEDNLKISK